MITKEQIIEAVKAHSFISKDHRKDLEIGVIQIVNLFPKDLEDEVYNTIRNWKEIILIGGNLLIPKKLLN